MEESSATEGAGEGGAAAPLVVTIKESKEWSNDHRVEGYSKFALEKVLPTSVHLQQIPWSSSTLLLFFSKVWHFVDLFNDLTNIPPFG